MTVWKKRRPKRTATFRAERYYDIVDDFGLIVSSFQSQYGIRLSRDLSDMPWSEFCDLLAGLGHDTALGRIVEIRAENNKDILAHFTPEQYRIRSEWRKRQAQETSQQSRDDFLCFLLDGLKKMAGGGDKHG